MHSFIPHADNSQTIGHRDLTQGRAEPESAASAGTGKWLPVYPRYQLLLNGRTALCLTAQMSVPRCIAQPVDGKEKFGAEAPGLRRHPV
jgi:hypothetical protein